jgi:inosine triphosphate pyrophosphatase
MKQLLVITGNKNKFAEIGHFLSGIPYELVCCAIELEEIQDLDPKEVIEHKAHEALKAGYRNFILEDTSLFINGLNRLPGTFIKWFLQELKVEGIHKLAQAMGNTEAYAQTIFAYVIDEKTIYYFEGVRHGHIVSARGDRGFGWSVIFQPLGSSQTYGELTMDEKQQYSQRAQALEKLRNFLLS